MPPRSDVHSRDGLVRAGPDIDRLPWAKPLLVAYEHDYGSVAPFFAGDPRRPEAWAAAIARVTRGSRDRAGIAAVVDAQLGRRGAPTEARAGVDALSRPGTVAVLTGQQAGLFGGPLYTLFKAITTIQLARQVAERHGTTTVPIFWIASEDHDWEEVRSAALFDRDGRLCTVALPELAGAGVQAVGSLDFDGRVAAAVEGMGRLLPRTVWTDELIDTLGRHYHEGSNLGAALAGWLDELLGRHGLVVFDGADPAAKPLVGDLFVSELESPERTAEHVRARGEALRARGHTPQVIPAAHATALFYFDGTGRQPVRYVDGQFEVGRDKRRPEDLRREAASHPHRFSPNVMLRPIVQDRLFPTVCYVAGPGELAYQAQFGDVYAAFGVERPLFASRASATVLDRAAMRFLDRHDVPFEALAVPDDSALNELVARVLTPAVGPAVQRAEAAMAGHLSELTALAESVDPTLVGAADTTGRRMQQALETLQRKIVRAAKRRDDTLRRQFTHARTVSFPNGQPQDRVLGVAAIINQYGPGLIDQLIDALPTDGSRHYLVVP